ncbi:unnamed protein product [Meloidogyne enterolobii]|uniref:Uncharacterized protein n=1 Tax=Meloidogyne enterolobii TaxID=390850 RepID=A0ACB0YNE6_MELEN
MVIKNRLMLRLHFVSRGVSGFHVVVPHILSGITDCQGLFDLLTRQGFITY